jgi:hypothetical protein
MKKRKAHSARSRAMKGLKGLKFCWQDTNPLDDGDHSVSDVQVGHDNYCYLPVAREMIVTHKDWFTKQLKLDWYAEITVVSVYPDGQEQRETRELLASNVVYESINDTAKEQIKDAMRHSGGKYITTEFVVICLGRNSEILKGAA